MPTNAVQHFRPRTPGGLDSLVVASSLATGLSAYWKMDEASGTRVDSLGANNATVTGTVSSNTGKRDNAIEVATGANYLSAGTNITPSGSDRSVACWVYPTDVAAQRSFLSSGIAYNNANPLWMLVLRQGGGSGPFSVYHAGSYVNGSTVASTSTWYHVAYTFASSVALLYVNGALEGSVFAADSGFAGAIFMGNSFSLFAGRMDEVGIWNRALTSTEVAQLYNGGSGVTYPAFA